MPLWYEVTSLPQSLGKPAGIPRVTASILQELLGPTDGGLRCCYFAAQEGVFLEAPVALVREWLARYRAPSATSATAPDAPPIAMPTPLTARLGRGVLSVGRAVYGRLPGWLRPSPEFVNRVLHRINQARQGVALLRRQLAARPGPPPLPKGLGPRVEWSSADILFSPGNGWDIPGYGPAVYTLYKKHGFRFVPFIHDVIPYKFPHFFGPGLAETYLAWLADVLWFSALVTTNSQHSRSDIIAFAAAAGTPEPPVEVLRLGDHLPVFEDSALPKQVAGLGADDRFALCVGTIEVRKNHLLLYQLWRRLVELHGDTVPRLVFVGRPGWLTADLLRQIREDPMTRKKIVILDNVSDSDLEFLYRHCLFTLYPSHYEGWGIPIAESLGHGKYCIASHSSSMPEIGADLVGYHDPLDLIGLVALVRQAMFDPAFLPAREKEIHGRYRPTTWGETGASLLAHIERHLGPIGGRP